MELFEQLFTCIDELIRLGHLAVTKQSAYGIEHDRPTEQNKRYWLSMIKEIGEKNEALKVVVGEGFEKNKILIDRKLSFFRSLTKRMGENSCHWSAYYDDIDKVMDRMYDAVTNIDEKYDIGK